MEKAIGRGEEDEWVVNCPKCTGLIHFKGFFDPTEPYKCDICDCEFLTTEISTDNGDIIK